MGFSLSAGVKKLLFIIFMFYLLVNIPPLAALIKNFSVEYRFFSFTEGIGRFNPLQLITHSFINVGFFPLLGSILILIFFGTQLEYAFGENRFLQLFFIGGAVSALVANLISIAVVHFGFAPIDMLFLSKIMGGSGAHYAILGAFAAFAPDREIVLFPIPIPVKIKYMIAVYALITLYRALSLSGGFEPIADFVGLFIGIECVRYWRRQGGDRW